MPEDDNAAVLKFTEQLIQDYRSLISETRRKFIPVKEASEVQILKIKSLVNGNSDLKEELINSCVPLIDPFLSGCATKVQKIVVLCLTAIQRFINNKCLSMEGADALIDTLWQLMELNLEDLRLLQTTILLLTTSTLVQKKLLAKAFTICIRLHHSKVPATINTAAAAVRQCASAVFERILKENPDLQVFDDTLNNQRHKVLSLEDIPPVNPSQLKTSFQDAYMLFQDVCLLLGDEPAMWFLGPVDLNRSLGLELIESLLSSYPSLFRHQPAFAYLLKSSLCPLIIKLFSPTLKIRPTQSGNSLGLAGVASAAIAAAAAAVATVSGGPGTGSSSTGTGTGSSNSSNSDVVTHEKPNFPMFVRLKRLISVIVNQYFHLLNTECEIYLSLLIRFMDASKMPWQRAMALEVLYKLTGQPELIQSLQANVTETDSNHGPAVCNQ